MNDNRPTPEKPTRRSHKSSMHHDWRWWKPKESASTAVTEDSYEDDDDDEEESGKGIDDYQDDQVSLLFGTAMLGRTIPKQRRPPHRWLEGWAARLWNQHWFPPGPWKLGQEQIQAPAVQFFKFFVVSIGSLIVIHYYAKIVNADRDEAYGLREMILFDGNHIALDLMVFFVVGRLYESSIPTAVDSWAWIVPSVGSALAQSWIASHSNSLHHSITAYEMHCTWTWQFRALLMLGALPTIVALVTMHLVYAARQKALLQKLLELLCSFLIFLAPYLSNPFFHLHHWYYAWILGMHANLHSVWWSRWTMKLLFGIYLNGIAIFGRDPIMSCAVTLYQSQNQHCPYLETTKNGTGSMNYTLELLLSTSTQQDWHNCSGQ